VIHIRYTVKESGLHGIGLFSDQDIKTGALICTASPSLDVDITQEEFDALSAGEQSEIRWWGFFDRPSRKWHVDFDVTRFMNHSYDANVTQDQNHQEAYLIAARDVRTGEELTQNYLEVETPEDLARRGIGPSPVDRR
jgi:SET domain-containing protein